MTDLTVFRVYEPWELGKDGYPKAWHDGVLRYWRTPVYGKSEGDEPPPIIGWESQTGPLRGHLGPINEAGTYPTTGGVKHLVRVQAGDRCVRCQHPFVVGLSGTMDDARDDREFRETLAMEMALDREDVPRRPASLNLRRKAVHWSPCDERCTHGGPVRWRQADDDPRGWVCDPEHLEDGGLLTPANVQSAIHNNWQVEAAWRILMVHHLNGRKHDLRWWNLCALCQRCHLVIQRKVTMEQVYPLEHTEWFRPYAAGYYASAYLGEHLTREETMHRLDELLALERVA